MKKKYLTKKEWDKISQEIIERYHIRKEAPLSEILDVVVTHYLNKKLIQSYEK